MATGTSQSAADEALRTTDENANFQRLTRLLMRGGLALLREVFDAIHPPANLPAVLGNPTIKSKLQTLRRNRVLTYPEWDCLYNPPSGAYGKSSDFDITLLCKLLREICNLSPSTGWDNLPNGTDYSREADVVRIKFYRNTIYGHNHSMEITNADFEKLWIEISEALLRIADRISRAMRDEWKKSIENLSRDPLTPDAKEYVSELRLWYKKDMETKDEIEKLIEKVDKKIDKKRSPIAKRELNQKCIGLILSCSMSSNVCKCFWSCMNSKRMYRSSGKEKVTVRTNDARAKLLFFLLIYQIENYCLLAVLVAVTVVVD